MERPLVLFSITNGWGIRNFIHTRLFGEVSQFADVGVATTPELLPYFSAMRERGEIAYVMNLPTRESVLWQRIRQLKKAILQAKFDISTARIKWRKRATGPFSGFILDAAWSFQRFLAAGWQLRVLEWLENRFAIAELPVDMGRVGVMVNCSPFDFRDNQLQRALHRISIPTISIIPSWDNPSTKGCIISDANTVLVWGRNQKQELLRYYPHLDPERIRISGIPQFDAYYRNLPDEFGREPFLGRLGIDPAHKVILYATCSERLFPGEPEIVAELVEAIVQGRFGNDAHLLIRCHPADRAARYQHLCATGRATIFPSSVRDARPAEKGPSEDPSSAPKAPQWNARWIPPEDEVLILAATIRHCVVCINTASTMTLDAFACDKPVVNIAYDGKDRLPYLDSVSRYYEYHHYLPIAQSGAVPVARSAEDLLNAVHDAIASPEKFKAERRRTALDFCFRPEDGSVEFIAREIERLCGAAAPRKSGSPAAQPIHSAGAPQNQ